MTVRPRSDRRAALVILCGDLADRLDLEAVEELVGPVHVVTIDGLCRDSGAVGRALRASGHRRAVVGLCSDGARTADLLTRARRSGMEPFGVATVSLGAAARASSASAAARIVSAAVARVRALPAGEDGHAVLGRASLSRTSLLSLGGAISVEAIAAVDEAACVGTARCGLCVGTCPRRAISSNGAPTVRIDASACDACGLCVPACPVGAIRLTGAGPAQIAAQLAVLLPETDAVVFRCRNASASIDDLPPGWAAIDLPSLAPVTPGWILQALAGGARAVRLAACAGACCSACTERVAFSRAVLEQLGAGDVATRVALLEAHVADLRTLDPLRAESGRIVLDEPRATVDALGRLGPPLRPATIDHRASPLGLLELDDAGCTLCGSCALACPTDALALDTAGADVVLRHDPRVCTGCALCVTVCPEHVISVRAGLDRPRLQSGPVALARATRRACPGCGVELPPDATARRVRELLGTSRLETDGLCPECARRAS
jgi:ferredoxin